MRNYLPGDVIAFGSKGLISDAIKLFTRSPLSHVAIVRAPLECANANIVESTTLYKGRRGVQENSIAERTLTFEGRIWWLPLSAQARSYLNYEALDSFLVSQFGKSYDMRQCLRVPISRIPALGRWLDPEDWRKVFCSELVGGALEAAGVLPTEVNCASLSPRDVCRLRIFQDQVQIKGPSLLIPNFGTRQVFFPEAPLPGDRPHIWGRV